MNLIKELAHLLDQFRFESSNIIINVQRHDISISSILDALFNTFKEAIAFVADRVFSTASGMTALVE